MREIPLESNTEALAFADAVVRLEFDLIVLLTGVGTGRSSISWTPCAGSARRSSPR
jgi:hypothetical protein